MPYQGQQLIIVIDGSQDETFNFDSLGNALAKIRTDLGIPIVFDSIPICRRPAELPTYGERVYVLGEVNVQGIYPLKQAQDLLAALALAGNTNRLAKEDGRVQLVRVTELPAGWAGKPHALHSAIGHANQPPPANGCPGAITARMM